MLKNILIPMDGSEISSHALTEVIAFAKMCPIKINLLYVTNFNTIAVDSYLSEPIQDTLLKIGHTILEHAQAQIPKTISSDIFLEHGRPAEKIIDFANQTKMDMIVIGSRGIGGIAGTIVGSVSQQVIEEARCPVTVVK